MRNAFLVAALFVSPALWGIDGPQTEPDYRSLYTRLSQSAIVVKATVAKRAGVAKRRYFTADDPLGKKSVGDDPTGGTLYTLTIKETLCRRSDWSDLPSVAEQHQGTVYIFVPWSERNFQPSPEDPARLIQNEALLAGKEYLFFLQEDPQQAELGKLYNLDPALTYYRAYWGMRGAVELPTEEKKGGLRDFATPLLSAVTELSKAVQARDPAAKKSQLTGLKYLADPGWRPAVEEAIKALETSPANR